ncbi:hypothetical protein ACS0TY_024703 [Phlomoides rotata]
MASVGVLTTILCLRIITLLTLAASVVVMGLNNFTDDDGSKTRFTDFIAYRYVLATGAVGFLYIVCQIPFAIYNVAQGKRLIRNGSLQEIDFFGDKVIALLLATGVGAGFGVTFELKRSFDDDDFDSKEKKYLDMANISTGLLLVGVFFMAVLLVFSSNRRRSSSPKMKSLFK